MTTSLRWAWLPKSVRMSLNKRALICRHNEYIQGSGKCHRKNAVVHSCTVSLSIHTGCYYSDPSQPKLQTNPCSFPPLLSGTHQHISDEGVPHDVTIDTQVVGLARTGLTFPLEVLCFALVSRRVLVAHHVLAAAEQHPHSTKAPRAGRNSIGKFHRNTPYHMTLCLAIKGNRKWAEGMIHYRGVCLLKQPLCILEPYFPGSVWTLPADWSRAYVSFAFALPLHIILACFFLSFGCLYLDPWVFSPCLHARLRRGSERAAGCVFGIQAR